MAGGTISRHDFQQLMQDGLHHLFEEANDKIPDTQWDDMFRVMPSKRAFETALGLVGMGMPSLKHELEPPKADSPRQGRPVKFVHSTFAQKCLLSREAKDDDRYGKLAQMIVPEMRRNFHRLQEYTHISLLDLGWTTQGYEPDGVSLFNTAHPNVRGGGTWSNRLATDTALSIEALKAIRVLGRKTKSESGKLTPITFRHLWVGPANEQLAHELVDSDLKPGQFAGGTAPNEKNFQKGRFQVHVLDYLDETTNPNAWFVSADKEETGFIHYTREKLNDDLDYDKQVRAFIYLMFERYSLGFTDPRGWAGSKGTG